jgi:hypothetical protein
VARVEVGEVGDTDQIVGLLIEWMLTCVAKPTRQPDSSSSARVAHTAIVDRRDH